MPGWGREGWDSAPCCTHLEYVRASFPYFINSSCFLRKRSLKSSLSLYGESKLHKQSSPALCRILAWTDVHLIRKPLPHSSTEGSPHCSHSSTEGSPHCSHSSTEGSPHCSQTEMPAEAPTRGVKDSKSVEPVKARAGGKALNSSHTDQCMISRTAQKQLDGQGLEPPSRHPELGNTALHVAQYLYFRNPNGSFL